MPGLIYMRKKVRQSIELVTVGIDLIVKIFGNSMARPSHSRALASRGACTCEQRMVSIVQAKTV